MNFANIRILEFKVQHEILSFNYVSEFTNKIIVFNDDIEIQLVVTMDSKFYGN